MRHDGNHHVVSPPSPLGDQQAQRKTFMGQLISQLPHVKKCQKMSKHVKQCQKMSKNVKTCQKMSKNVKHMDISGYNMI